MKIRLSEKGKAVNGVQFFEVFSDKDYKVKRVTPDGEAVIQNEDGFEQYLLPEHFVVSE